MNKTRVTVIILFIISGLIVAIGIVGGGPTVKIPADTKPGAEYSQPNEAEITAQTKEMLLSVLKEKYPAGTSARRDAHPLAHGCVRASFQVLPDLPANLAKGVFYKERSYPVWMRLSNGSADPKKDADGDVRGMALKLMGVPGPKLLPDEIYTQDFLLINYPVMPAGSPDEYLALFDAAIHKRPMSYFFGGMPWNWKLGAFQKVLELRGQKVADLLDIDYFSTTPYRLGEQAVKYKLSPCQKKGEYQIPADPTDRFLRDNLQDRLSKESVCMDFYVQLQKDPIAMPVEDAAVRWDEKVSVPIKVARIEIPQQEFNSEKQNQFCEQLSYTPWHSLKEHQPLGGINRVRKAVYSAIAAHRFEQNGVTPAEPFGSERF
ncbi:MAG: catalase family protein [Leptospiraceae bacterium]|nr:catalase family protein [Leptospiraceae bacterium]